MIELVMFDLDGTLVDSAPDIVATINDVLRHDSLPELPASTIRSWIGHGARHTLATAYAHSVSLARGDAVLSSALDAPLLDRLMSVYARSHEVHCGVRSIVYPQVREVLSRLRERSMILAVVTNKEERFAQELLARMRLAPWFATVVGGDTLPTRKPHPAPLRHCLALHGVAADRALMVGDSSIDMQAARAAGVEICLVLHGYDAGAHTTQADAILESFDQLDAYVESRCKAAAYIPSHEPNRVVPS